MNAISENILRAVGLVFVFGFFLWASNEDYKETVIYHMPQAAFDSIYDKLGHGCTDRQIVDMYMTNKEYYDSLSTN